MRTPGSGDPLGAEGAAEAGESRGICGEDPDPERFGEDKHPRMPDPHGEAPQSGEAPFRFKVPHIAQHGSPKPELSDFLVFHHCRLLRQLSPLPFCRGELGKRRQAPGHHMAAGTGHLHNSAA
jgi:hypothetical protein